MVKSMVRFCAGFLMVVMLSSGTASAQQGPWVSYRPSESSEIYRVEATSGATPENVSSALDALSPRAADNWINLSPDGQWMLMETERWGCSGWACLARVKADFSEGGLVSSGAEPVHPEGFSAIASGGDLIVWVGQGCTTHSRDLFVSRFSGGSWDMALCLSAGASSSVNEQPAISADGSRVLFICDADICSIGTDGNDLRLEISTADEPGEGSWSQIRSPDWDPDGNIVFEAEDGAEQIWRQDHLSCNMNLINAAYTNDNSPCVLPDGRIASLWLNRPGNPDGFHELKVMNADGTGELMLVTTPVDVFDVGIGCGGSSAKIFDDGFESGAEDQWSEVVGDATVRFQGCWRRFSPSGSPLSPPSRRDFGEDG